MSDSYDPMDCALPGSSVHGISQARMLEWVAISFFRESSQPRDWTWVSCIISCIADRIFTAELPGKTIIKMSRGKFQHHKLFKYLIWLNNVSDCFPKWLYKSIFIPAIYEDSSIPGRSCDLCSKWRHFWQWKQILIIMMDIKCKLGLFQTNLDV